jgi:hypothetical protein
MQLNSQSFMSGLLFFKGETMALNPPLQRDANWRTVDNNEAYVLESTWTFVAGTTGATGAHTVFTATGNCLVNVFAVCDTDLTSGGAATIEMGVAGNTASLIAQTTATDLDDGEIWVDASPAVGIEALPGMKVLNDGADIILTVGTTTVTGGAVDIYCIYRPLSAGASITVTTPA